jgi:hypothetical protein
MASGKDAMRRKAKEKKKRLAAKSGKRRGQVTRERVDPAALPKTAVPQHILDDIQAKKGLLAGDDLTRQIVRRYVKKNPDVAKRFSEPQFLRSKDYEAMRKWARQELRVLVGMFVLETDFSKLLRAPVVDVLDAHRSTEERLPYYHELYAELFAGRTPEHILDLCCGLNPCSYSFLGGTPKYTAVDVSPQLMDFVQAWFKENKILGKAYAADVTQLTPAQLAVGDTVFIFKGLDVLERIRYGYGEQLLAELFKTEGRRVIVSFATATISGTRSIAVTKRSWIERWADTHKRTVHIHDTPGERYYVLE